MKLQTLRRLIVPSVARIIFRNTPPTRLFHLRARLLRLMGHQVGRNVRVVNTVRILGARVVFEDDVFIGHEVLIVGGADSIVTFHERVDVGPRATFLAGSHQVGPSTRRAGEGISFDIEIGSGSWIGGAATIIGPSSIGAGSIVAAGTTIVGDQPSNSLLTGFRSQIKRELPGVFTNLEVGKDPT